MNDAFAIHWFRRDLRVAGNPALQWALKKYNGRVVGLFCFDSKFLARSDFSHNRFQFFLESLQALKKELHEMGGELLVLDQSPLDAMPVLFKQFKKNPDCVTWNRDYEPFARHRDSEMEKKLTQLGVQVHTESDHLLIEPQELLFFSKKSGPYQIYTPFSRVWLEMLKLPQVKHRIERQTAKSHSITLKWKPLFIKENAPTDSLTIFLDKNKKHVDVPIPKAGSFVALQKIRAFADKVSGYSGKRDIPSVDGTSQMSIYLKNGSITTAKIISELSLQSARSESAKKYLNELIWREFYYHILFFHPHVEQESFKKQYTNIKWENDSKLFKAWTEGKTGFPIVDAGMRQLNATGWMHNRVRMIVASFLTKDLLIDWRWGEKYFMEKLLDGDLAPNNGGWQWAASTGCDAQPYFRVFNPTTQSEKFDPDGVYLKRWIPELRHLSAKVIHNPAPLERGDYPEQVVDHAERRERAIELFKRA